MTDTESRNELKPCRHCEKPTRQRAQGIPYCSMECIGGRRREKNMETFECPYPSCGWEHEWNPDVKLSVVKARTEIELHRKEHGHDPEF